MKDAKEMILINAKPGKLRKVTKELEKLGFKYEVVAGDVIHSKYDIVISAGHKLSDANSDARKIFGLPGIARVLVEFKSLSR